MDHHGGKRTVQSRSQPWKTEKGGYTYVDFSMQDNTVEAVVKDGKGAIKTEDGWQSLTDAAKDNGEGGFNPRLFLARRMQNYKTPAVEAGNLRARPKNWPNPMPFIPAI